MIASANKEYESGLLLGEIHSILRRILISRSHLSCVEGSAASEASPLESVRIEKEVNSGN